MKVLPISQNKYNFNYKANARQVYDSKGLALYRTTTYYFRSDLDWEKLIKFLCCFYEGIPKVNFINHACSNGMEPLSFAMALMTYAPKIADKFFPILAKDINELNITYAKGGFCEASLSDFMRIKNITQGKYNEYLDLKPPINKDSVYIMSPKSNLAEKVIFEQGDIFNDVESLPSENTFLSCRNCWMYFSNEKRAELAEHLGKQLRKNAIILLGFLDLVDGYAGIYLEKNGFRRCGNGSERKNIMYVKY